MKRLQDAPTLRRYRMAGFIAGLIGLAVVVAGCAPDSSLVDQYRAGDNKGYIAGDFRVVEIPPADRTAPVEFAGTLDSGKKTTSDDYRGRVLVVNFWYAACAPCRVEAPELEATYQAFADDDVSFLGVNLYDGAAASIAFAETYGVSYPSVLTVVDGSIKLAFAEQTPLNAVPVTLVLDRDGRVASRIIGQLPDSSVLNSLVRDVLEEK
ncbi:TlpA family protein disulfide reductase [Microbacterium sp. MC2]